MDNPIREICRITNATRRSLSVTTNIPYNTLSQFASGYQLRMALPIAQKLSDFLAQKNITQPAIEIQANYRIWLTDHPDHVSRRAKHPAPQHPEQLGARSHERRKQVMLTPLPDEETELRAITIFLPVWVLNALQTYPDSANSLIYRALFEMLRTPLRALFSTLPRRSRIPDSEPNVEIIRLMYRYQRRTRAAAKDELVPLIQAALRENGMACESPQDAIVIGQRILLEYETTHVATRLGIPPPVQAMIAKNDTVRAESNVYTPGDPGYMVVR
jgi:hypothetical protein